MRIRNPGWLNKVNPAGKGNRVFGTSRTTVFRGCEFGDESNRTPSTFLSVVLRVFTDSGFPEGSRMIPLPNFSDAPLPLEQRRDQDPGRLRHPPKSSLNRPAESMNYERYLYPFRRFCVTIKRMFLRFPSFHENNWDRCKSKTWNRRPPLPLQQEDRQPP